MIFYFSGTGNSLYAAKKIGEAIGEPWRNIAVLMKDGTEIELSEQEAVGFVFPIYAWAPPKMVLDYAKKLDLAGHYVFAVGTYGQNVGRFDRFFAQAGISLNSAFALNMPNNYLMIWEKATQERCLAEAEKRLAQIGETITQRQDKIDIPCVLNGRPASESQVAFAPAMNIQWSATLRDVSDFYVTEDCIGCGTCERVCNGSAIRLINGRLVWGETCTKCLACLHLCPRQAIQFGPYTVGAGRYKNPNIPLGEMIINGTRSDKEHADT